MSITILKKARPNGFDIRLIKIEPENDYVVEERDVEGYWEYTDEGVEWFISQNRAEAEAVFAERCAELAETPNRELQARYDELHGTDNGYALWDVPREH